LKPSQNKKKEIKPEEIQMNRNLNSLRQKGRSLIDLARVCVDGQLDSERLADLINEAAVRRLLRLRGVGRWSAEYVLLGGAWTTKRLFRRRRGRTKQPEIVAETQRTAAL
jgi:DNA-3-methyladenine glycosylase II